MDILIADRVLVVILLWAVTYTVDYYLTILGARLYKDGANSYIVFEGSYELTPVFKADVDSTLIVSPTFVRNLVLSSGAIFVVWLVDVEFRGGYYIFAGLVGAFFLREAAIYIRHIRNIAMFLFVRAEDSIRGRIEYRRWLTLRISAIELFSFSIFYYFLYQLDRSWFFLGGALACLVTGIQHLFWASSARNPGHVEEREDEL
jgi:hypothetical protein